MRARLLCPVSIGATPDRGRRHPVSVQLEAADAGQMNLYLNSAREHLTLPEEADPVGIILCSDKDAAVVRYARAYLERME